MRAPARWVVALVALVTSRAFGDASTPPPLVAPPILLEAFLGDRARVALEIVGPDGRVTWRCQVAAQRAAASRFRAEGTPLGDEMRPGASRCEQPAGWFRSPGAYRVRARIGHASIDQAVSVTGDERRIEVVVSAGGQPPAVHVARVLAAPVGVHVTRSWTPATSAVPRYVLRNGGDRTLHATSYDEIFRGTIERRDRDQWAPYLHASICGTDGMGKALAPGDSVTIGEGSILERRDFAPGSYRFRITLSEEDPRSDQLLRYEVTDDFVID